MLKCAQAAKLPRNSNSHNTREPTTRMNKITEIRENILREALADEDGIYVGIFDGEVTPEERAIEKELPLIVDDGLLHQLSPGTYRITSDGRRALQQRKSGRYLHKAWRCIFQNVWKIIIGVVIILAAAVISELLGLR